MNNTMTATFARCKHRARILGAIAGREAAAASIDVLSPSTLAAMLTVDDPDLAPPSWLAGKWTDEMTVRDLMEALGLEDPPWEDQDALCDIYENTAEETYWARLKAAVRQP